MRKNVLIIGAGNGGEQLLRELSKQKELNYKLVGFLDDDPKKQKKKIKGLPVLGTTENLETFIKKHKINLVFIAFPSVHGKIIRSLVERCNKLKVECRIIPKLLEIIHNKVSFNLIRQVSIEDLVGRPIIKTDQSKFENFFHNKKVLITGAAGSIGSELARQIVEYSPESLIAFDSWETGIFELEHELRSRGTGKKEFIIGNVRDAHKVEWIFKTFKPDVVFHAAAYKHVHIMNLNPEEAIKNNIVGTKNLAELAGIYNAERFVFISTDKAVNPEGIMGASKSFGEALIMHYQQEYKKTIYSAVRFGNVLGSYGSVVPLFQKQIAAGGPVTVTHPKMTRFFMTIPEAVQLILHASRMGSGGEIYVLDMGEPIKIMDLATTMIRLSGLEPNKDIMIKITGIRPGEKMSEELFTQKEALHKTSHTLVFETKNMPQLKGNNVMKAFDTLTKLSEKNNRSQILREFKKIFPTIDTAHIG